MKKQNISLMVIVTCISVTIFVISLIPIFQFAFYTYPVCDDIAFSLSTRKFFENNNNFLDFFSLEFTQIKHYYFNWQGTFSAIFIFSLQPAVFSENVYWITTLIMVFALTFSTFFLLDTIFTTVFKAKRLYTILITSCILFCTLQFLPNKNQALYWFNGSSYYTLFYSFSLVFFALIIRLILTKRSSSKIGISVFAFLLALVIGGGNFSTALFTVCLLAVFLLISFIHPDFKSTKTKYLIMTFFIVLIIAFLISILAPGNSVRQKTFEGYNLSPAKAIAFSIFYYLIYIQRWTTAPNLILFIFITPVLYKISANTTFKFHYPLLFTIISFLCFATQLTPPLYAMGTLGGGRQQDMFYYSYYIFMILNILYFCGYLRNKNENKFSFIEISTKRNIIISIFLLIVLFISGCFAINYREMTSVITFSAIKNGEVQKYNEDFNRLISKIKNNEITTPEEVYPVTLFHEIFPSEDNFDIKIYPSITIDYYSSQKQK